MEVGISKGYSCRKDGKINDFFVGVNPQFFLEEIDYNSVFSYDQAFEFTILYIHFEQHCGDYIENVFGGGAEGVVRRKVKQYKKHLEKIISALPAGIAVYIHEETETTNYKRKLFHLRLKIDVSVTADYSKQCFNRLNENNIVHEKVISKGLKDKAEEFKERILGARLSTLQVIKNDCDNKHSRYDSVVFNEACYHDSGTSPRDEDYRERSTTYNTLGQKQLVGLEQCYGMAWAIAELSAPTVRCRISVVDEWHYQDKKWTYKKAVRLDRYPYKKREEPKQYADW